MLDRAFRTANLKLPDSRRPLRAACVASDSCFSANEHLVPLCINITVESRACCLRAEILSYTTYSVIPLRQMLLSDINLPWTVPLIQSHSGAGCGICLAGLLGSAAGTITNDATLRD